MAQLDMIFIISTIARDNEEPISEKDFELSHNCFFLFERLDHVPILHMLQQLSYGGMYKFWYDLIFIFHITTTHNFTRFGLLLACKLLVLWVQLPQNVYAPKAILGASDFCYTR